MRSFLPDSAGCRMVIGYVVCGGALSSLLVVPGPYSCSLSSFLPDSAGCRMRIGYVVSGGAYLNGTPYPDAVYSPVGFLYCDAYRASDAPTVSSASVCRSALIVGGGGERAGCRLVSGTLWFPPLVWVGSRPVYLLLPSPLPAASPGGVGLMGGGTGSCGRM